MCQTETRSLLRFGLPLYLILASFPAYSAEPYRFELRGGLSNVDTDSKGYAESLFVSEQNAYDASSDRLEFAGEYFFRPVEANSGPLKEAAFLERASALMFSMAEGRADNESKSTWGLGGSVEDFTSWTESNASDYQLRYQFIAPKRPWIGIVGYGYADNTTEISGISEPQETDEKFTSYSVGIGRYVGPRTSVIAEYGRSHRDTDLRPPIGIGGLDSLTLSVRHETLTVGVHSLLELGTRRHLGLTAALHETAATSFPDDPIGSYEVGVTYYPRTDISVALSATGEYRTDTNSGDIHGYMLEGRWFITESVAVGLRYETTDFRLRFADSFGFLSTTESNSDGFRFNVSWRY